METNLVLKVEDLTPDFADGMRKLFANATLYIRVESGASSSQTTSGGETPSRRGRPAKSSSDAETSNNAAPKKRGRKPGSKASKPASTEGPKKRGRKPKNSSPAE
ncbi:hypothetical protein [Aridibaculum aurantiacum]|uniref:hypothetical protein n=1 Tax=Aridibaculum aurantiacum TaxID=2810307 RepID=UPI001A966F3D|nr:hypothetical protein [Aridibaculum aurantiacum]